jgi:polyisoprenyl-phosphate glycosyltransferase
MDGSRLLEETIDVVIPAFNEEVAIGRLIEELFVGVAGLPYRFEVIVVDDGSHDRTSAVVQSYFERYPVKLVRLTRNFGKEAALLAGLDHASGAATLLMDADLQHPIAAIPAFIEHWRAGYQCVYGVKQHRDGEGLVKRLCARLFYAVVNRGSDPPIPPGAGDFRLLDRNVVRALSELRERVRFTKGLYAWLGFRSIGIPFVPPPRAAGRSRFDAGALARLAWDGLTSFSDLPLRVGGILGAVVAAGALVYALFVAARTLVFGVDIPGWATLTVAITFLSGLQILFLGLLGQYVRNVFIETKQRPSYVVSEIDASPQLQGVALRAEHKSWRSQADSRAQPRSGARVVAA